MIQHDGLLVLEPSGNVTNGNVGLPVSMSEWSAE
jgi:hypothetical protein